ncbi:hypothetical protein A2T55_16325 [Brevibacterium linens]|uniref:Polysaccharide chain length determinant N-terminal domain-containing protein n=1 Tax=Brevibacterium linens TaxID=1703 RepID=A0A144MIG2_BRELN|nr:Wzz/FepE/Etk N-terminal domain-containing protein [Brevibacterium linens]AMT95081.1 hypothetical protein A2T55_16325 [Brevibacterium linens]
MEEASLRRILTVIRIRWRLVSAVAVPVLLICWIYAASLPPSYTSTIVMSFAPGEDTESGPAFARMISPYELTATSHATITKAERDAGMTDGELRDHVSADLPTDELELSVEVTTTRPETSVVAARSISDTVKAASDEDQRAVMWNVNELPASPNGTPLRRALIVIAAAGLAGLLGGFIALWREGNRPRIWLPDDLRTIGIPVLQQIPRRDLQKAARGTAIQNRVVTRAVSRLCRPLLWELSRHSSRSEDPNDVIVTTLDQERTDITPIAAGLRQEAAFRGKEAVNIHSAAWDAIYEPARSFRPRAETLCLLVVPAGYSQEHLKSVVDLIRGQGARIFGSIFLSR